MEGVTGGGGGGSRRGFNVDRLHIDHVSVQITATRATAISSGGICMQGTASVVT